jgi:hypothetical protein
MGKVRVGVGRFYNGNLLELKEGEKISIKLSIEQYQIDIFISDKPRHILRAFEMSPPVPKDPSVPIKPSARNKMTIPGPEKFPADLYIELVASKEIDLQEDLVKKFNEKDKEARSKVGEAGEKYIPELKKVLDYAAGLIGLRINSELVRVPILEVDQFYCYRQGTSYSFTTGFKLNLVKEVEINSSEGGAWYFLKRISRLRAGNDQTKISESLGWMLRGWSSEDKVLKFVSFFTALESIMPKSKNPYLKEFELKKQQAEKIINSLQSENEKRILLEFIGLTKAPNPLNASFEEWSKKLGLTGWKDDVKVFKIFNRTRNLLLHTGNLGDIEKPEVKGEEIVSLESLVTKYLSKHIYGDADSYDVLKTSEPLK